MTSGLLALAREGLLLSLALAAPLVIAALIASALTGIVGAVTQVRDPSLGMAPRVAAVALALIASAPFIAHQVVAFAARALALVAEVGRGTGT